MLLSKKNRQTLLGPLSRNNPVIVQVLGICSALAVTAKLEPAFVMAVSVTAVLAFSNVIISMFFVFQLYTLCGHLTSFKSTNGS